MDIARALAGHLKRYRDNRTGELHAIARKWQAAPASHAAAATLVNLTLHVRRWGYVEVWLRGRQVWSRLSYARKGAGAAADAATAAGAAGACPASRRLSLLCPTRERPAGLRALITSVRKTAAKPDRIELLFYIDADDPTREACCALLTDPRVTHGMLCVPIVGPPISVSRSWNILAAHSTGDVLLMTNDDQVYVDYGWDVRIDEEYARFADEVACMFFEKGQYGPAPGQGRVEVDFPMVTRRWYETLGYFTPGIFEFWANEIWIIDIARRVGRLHPISNVFVDHIHCKEYKAPYDRTYQRHRAADDRSKRDLARFLNTATHRNLEAAKLSAAIAATSTTA